MTPTEWLLELGYDAKPITLEIKGVKWEGSTYHLNSRKVLYLVGEYPRTWTNRVCFQFEGSEFEWYVASYFQDSVEELPEEQKKYHPFGKSWLLHPWDLEGGKIDQFEPRTYKRLKAVLHEEN